MKTTPSGPTPSATGARTGRDSSGVSTIACGAVCKSTLVAILESGKPQTVVTYGTSIPDGIHPVAEGCKMVIAPEVLCALGVKG